MKNLVIKSKNCVGCKVCELACSMYHFKTHKPSLSAIKIIKYDETSRDIPTVCLHCEDPVCMKVCVVGAIYRDVKTNAVKVDINKCIKCKLCVYCCPYGAINFDTELKIPVKCDLCDGEPQCVKVCPADAISYEEVNNAIAKVKTKVATEMLYEEKK